MKTYLYKLSLITFFLVTTQFVFATKHEVTQLTDGYNTGEFRYEIENANVGDTILVNVSGTLQLTNTITVPNGGVVVIGPHPIHFKLDGTAFPTSITVFDIPSGSVFKLYNITVQNFPDNSIFYFDNTSANDSLIVDGCLFEGNSTSFVGAILNSNESSLTAIFNACSFINNVSGNDGGVISIGSISYSGGSILITNCTFYNNDAGAGAGGAIYLRQGDINLVNNTFHTNFSNGDYGTSVLVYDGNCNLQNNVFYNASVPASQFERVTGVVTDGGGNVSNQLGIWSTVFGSLGSNVEGVADPGLNTTLFTDGFGLKYFPIEGITSPCVDINLVVPITTYDARRVWRNMDGGLGQGDYIDAGAVEFTPNRITIAADWTIVMGNYGTYIGNEAIVFEGTGVLDIPVSGSEDFFKDNTIINGFSQRGSSVPGPGVNSSSVTPAVTNVKFNASSLSSGQVFKVNGNNVTIAGLSIVNTSVSNIDKGILCNGSSNLVVSGCHIGVDETGMNTVSSGFNLGFNKGIDLENATNAKIGTADYLKGVYSNCRNVIAGNSEAQIYDNNGSNHTISNNFIGANAMADNIPTGASPPFGNGITLIQTTTPLNNNNIIGGNLIQDRNIISGLSKAILISGQASDKVLNNFIGTDYNGNSGGTFANLNVIYGVNVTGSNAIGNRIGDPNKGNVIGNYVNAGILCDNNSTSIILGNKIGVGADNTTNISYTNTGSKIGIHVRSYSSYNLIGGCGANTGNYIDYSRIGIKFENFGSDYDTIKGNYIGVDPLGNPAGNDTAIYFLSGISGVVVGDTLSGCGNEIAYNNYVGIVSDGTGNSGLVFSGNSIHENGASTGMGIDLDENSTPDITYGSGPLDNNGILPPKLISAFECGSSGYTTLTFEVNNDNLGYPIIFEFFQADVDGQEGETFLTSYKISSFLNYNDQFSINLPGAALATGVQIVATATGEYLPNITSEFSDPVSVSAPPSPPSLTISSNTICEGDPLPWIIASGYQGTPVYYSDAALTMRLDSGMSYTVNNVSGPGSYIYFVIDSTQTCSSSASSITLTVNALPTPAISGNIVVCEGATEVYSVSAYPSITWDLYSQNSSTNTNSTTSTENVMFGTPMNGIDTLSVSVIDALGCSGTDTLFISLNANPIASAGVDMVVDCSTPSVNLDGSGSDAGMTYSWTTGSGNIVSGATTLSPIVDAVGTYTITVTNSTSGCSSTDDVDVTEDLVIPVADAGIGGVIDCNNSTLTLDGSGSDAGMTYAWSTGGGNIVSGATTLSPIVDAAGTYTITVANSTNGCTASASTTVTEDLVVPVADAGTGGVIDCNNSTLTLDGTGSDVGMTYAWTTGTGNIVSGGTTMSPIVDAAGNYTITVTNSTNGCSSADIATVTEDLVAPVANAGADLTINCSTAGGQVTLDGTGSDAGMNYLWTTGTGNIVSGSTTISAVADAGGTYTITVTNATNGCSSTDDVVVATDLTPPVASAGVDMIIDCFSPDVTLDGTGSDAAMTYLWTTGAGNFVSGATTTTPDVNAAGTYTITVTNSLNGCSATDDAIVTTDTISPIANAGIDGVIDCNNPSLTLDGTGSDIGMTYAWTTGTGNIVSGGTTMSPIVDAAGNYTITVTNSTNGCSSTDIAIVTSDFTTPTVVANATATNLCDGDVVTFSGSGSAVSYAWNNGVTDGVSTSSSVGAMYYVVTGTASNGCSDQDSVYVTVNALPSVVANATSSTICNGDMVTLTGSGANSYSWDNGVIDGTGFTPSSTTTYTVTGNDVNGCINTDQVTVTVNSVPSALISGNSLVCGGSTDSYSVSAANTYSWTISSSIGSSLSSATTMNTNITFGSPTTLSVDSVFVTVTDANSCVNSDTLLVSVGVQPQISVTPSDTSICGSDSVNINVVTVTSNIYQWSNGPTTANQTVSPASTTTYYLDATSTDIVGCVTQDSATVNVNSVPTISFVSNDISCNGAADGSLDITVLSGTPMYYYTINGLLADSSSTSTYTINSLSAGSNIPIFATDANGCSSLTSNFTIVEPAAITYSTVSSVDVSCFGLTNGEGYVNLTSGGTQPYSFVWVDTVAIASVTGAVDSVYTGFSSGFYNCQITDANGCSITTATIYVSEPAQLVASISSITDVTCFGSTDGSLTGTVSGGIGTLNYEWYLDGVTALNQNITTVSGLAPGDYTFEVTDGNGCTSMTGLETVSEPAEIIVNAVGTDITCFGGADGQININVTSGGVTPFTYSWDGGLSFTAGTNPYNVSGLNSGTYSVLVQDANSCTSTSSSITINAPSSAVVATVTAVDPSCFGSADGGVSIGASGGSSPYTFNLNSTNSNTTGNSLTSNPLTTIDNGVNGDLYTVIVFDANSCSDTAQVTLVEPTAVSYSVLTLADDTCSQGVGLIQVTSVSGGTGSGYTYSVNSGTATTNATMPVSAGTNSVEVFDANGCSTVQSVAINDLNGVLAGGTSGIVETCPGEYVDVIAFGGQDYIWMNSTGDTLYQGLDSINIFADSNYAFYIEILSGSCSRIDSAFVKIISDGCGIGEIVNNVFTPDGDGINDYFVFDLPVLIQESNTVSIYNRWGDLIRKIDDYNNVENVWDGANEQGVLVPAGTYFYIIEVPNANYTNNGWIQVIR